jgi:hypothetical protein
VSTLRSARREARCRSSSDRIAAHFLCDWIPALGHYQEKGPEREHRRRPKIGRLDGPSERSLAPTSGLRRFESEDRDDLKLYRNPCKAMLPAEDEMRVPTLELHDLGRPDAQVTRRDDNPPPARAKSNAPHPASTDWWDRLLQAENANERSDDQAKLPRVGPPCDFRSNLER